MRILTLITMMMLMSCTANQRARNFGGEQEIKLPCNQRLIDIAWKGDSLWYATREMQSGEYAETYTFQEHSSLGVMEGTVVLHECN